MAYREIAKGTQSGFSEDKFFKLALGSGFFQGSEVETARGLVTGFLLSELAGESKYDDFTAADASAKGVESFTGEALAKRAGFEHNK